MQGMFQLCEINQMERKMCQYLEHLPCRLSPTTTTVGTVFPLGSYSFIIASPLAAQDHEHTTPWLNIPSFMQ